MKSYNTKTSIEKKNMLYNFYNVYWIEYSYLLLKKACVCPRLLCYVR